MKGNRIETEKTQQKIKLFGKFYGNYKQEKKKKTTTIVNHIRHFLSSLLQYIDLLADSALLLLLV